MEFSHISTSLGRQERGLYQLATFSMGTRFPSHRNQEINGSAGVEIPPLVRAVLVSQTGFNKALGFGRGTLEMPLAKGLPGGLSFQKESHTAQLWPEQPQSHPGLALPPLTVLSKQSSAAQNKSLKLTCRETVQATGGREQEPAGLRSNPKKGDHCGPGTESPTPEASLTNTGCLFSGLQILASSFYSQQRSLDKRQPPHNVGGRD